MSATTAFATNILGLLFTNVNHANVGDATGLRSSSTAGVFYLSLHDGTPGVGGGQATNETVYTNYARQDEARSTAQWTVTSGVCDNDNEIAWPACGATGDNLDYIGIGSDVSGAGNLFLFGALTTARAIASGATPTIAAGALDIACS
jgi:hypothetical protein